MFKRKIHRLTVILTVIAILMFFFSFAITPLYKRFCQVTGINAALSEKDFFAKNIFSARNVTIEFLATNNEKLSWEFFPREKKIIAHPNQVMTVYFHAKNTSSHAMTVQAIPSFTPALSAKYFHKIECFCFKQQTLQAGEAREMPIVFRIDDDLPKNIQTITLAYTLFDVTKRISS